MLVEMLELSPFIHNIRMSFYIFYIFLFDVFKICAI
jgi:hypothetical protein